MKPKLKYLLVLLTMTFLGCSKQEFEKQDQNPLPFTKSVTIEDIKSLYNDSPLTLSESFLIEGTIIGLESNALYLQEKAGSAIKVSTNGNQKIEIGQLIRGKVGGQVLSRIDDMFLIDNIVEIEQVRQGNATSLTLTLPEIETNFSTYASSLITITDVVTENVTEVTGGLRYELNTATGTIYSFLPDGADYGFPEEAAGITGVLTKIGTDLYLNTRIIQDIQEVIPPPTLFEQIALNSGQVNSVIFDNEQTLAAGVKQIQAQYMNSENQLSAFTLFEVDLTIKGTSLEVGLANNNNAITARHSLVNMARTKDVALASSGWEVLGGITGDFWTTSPVPPQRVYEPFGPVIKDGQELKSTFYDNREFFGITKDGTAIIGNKTIYDQVRSQLNNALGGRQILKDNEIVNIVSAKDARPAIGYTDDNKVYLFLGDGRQPDWSNGFNTEEIAKILSAVGVTTAVYINGGDYAMAVGKNLTNNTINNVSRPS